MGHTIQAFNFGADKPFTELRINHNTATPKPKIYSVLKAEDCNAVCSGSGSARLYNKQYFEAAPKIHKLSAAERQFFIECSDVFNENPKATLIIKFF